MKSRTLLLLGAHSTLALCLDSALISTAFAQGEPAPGESQQMGEITVTGSALPSAPDEVAVPVITIDSAQIATMGVNSNALEILRKAIPAFAGRSNTGNSNANNNNQNTAGGSQLQLRNLPTLILVNGRRVANSGVGGINGKNFVDVSQIPAAAIDRIEVLADGASSLYGSDAIGGVVNIILKSDYSGFSGGARVASADGGYSERGAYFTAGGNVAGFNITVTANSQRSDPLFQNDRSFASPLYGKTSAIPGVVNGGNYRLAGGINSPSQNNPTGVDATAGSITDLLNNGSYVATTPGAISSGFDVSPYQTLLLRQNQDALAATFSKTLIEDSLEAFGDVMLSHNQSFTRWLPVATVGNKVPAGSPYNPLTTDFTGVTFDYLPYTHNFYDDVSAQRLTLGLKGKLNTDWTWETALVYSKSDLNQRQDNVIFKPNIARAIAGGYDINGNPLPGGQYSEVYGGFSITNTLVLQPALDPFALGSAVNPAALANLYGSEQINTSSQLASWDAKVVGKLGHLPAGDVAVATGIDARRESLSGQTDLNGRVTDPATGSTTGNDQQWLGGTYADPFSKSRDIYGVFVEARIPITSALWNVPGAHALDFTVAGREEKYSDVGNSFVPKIGFRWEPIDNQFSLHGNYSKSFSAPGLYSEYGPTDTRQVGAGVIQGIFGSNYTGMPFNGEDGNNPGLKPAKSTSKVLGLTLRPNLVPGFSLAVDYSDIKLKGFAGGIGFNNILGSINAFGSKSPFFANLAVDNFPGMPGATQTFANPGDLLNFLTNTATGRGDPAQAERLYVIDQFRNLASLSEKSLTVSGAYLIPTDRYGNFLVSTTGAIFNQFKFQALPGTPPIDYAGNSNNTGVFGGTLPKYRFYTTLDWTLKQWELTIGNTYVSSTNDTGANGTSTPSIHVSSYVTWDVRAGYNWHISDNGFLKTVKLAVGVNNIGNRMPPLAPRAFTDNNADVSTFSPIGRLTYASIALDF